nr:EOG090X09MN [Eulimnadia texana]
MSEKSAVPRKTMVVPIQWYTVNGLLKYQMLKRSERNFRRVTTSVTVSEEHSVRLSRQTGQTNETQVFVDENKKMPTHRILYFFPYDRRSCNHLLLDLKLVVLKEEESGGFTRSPKVVLHLLPPQEGQYSRAVSRSSASFIKLSFTSGGSGNFSSELGKVLIKKSWETASIQSGTPVNTVKPSNIVTRSGIVGIERKMQEKVQQTSENISIAFQDLKNLMDMAKDMVNLARNMATRIKEKQGDISEDETIAFKSYLLSLGIDDPVTRESYASGDAYRTDLAKQIATILEQPIKESGGMMGMTDAFCRVNRARGLELLSPDDFYQACRLMAQLKLPVRMRAFESGVLVLQLQSQSDTELDKKTLQMLEERSYLTAEDLARDLGISVILARERLLSAERAALACRDDTTQGLVFYPNLFLTREN